jgi:hypothetical protein
MVTTEQLRKTAIKQKRKSSKKFMILSIKRLTKIIKQMSKEGKFSYVNTIDETKDNSWLFFVVFRWYRRYSKLNVKLVEYLDDLPPRNSKKKIIDGMRITINW